MLAHIVFLLITFVMTSSAWAVIFARNPIYSVLNMVVCFFAVGGLYLLLGAPFLAMVHLIVYAGAIMVLFLFVILMMNLNDVPPSGWSKWTPWLSLGLGGAMTAVVAWVGIHGQHVLIQRPVSTQTLGLELFQYYAGPFELSAILFLGAVVGVVVLTRLGSNGGQP